MMKKSVVLAFLLAATSSQAASNFCQVAGRYTGVYTGNSDQGTLVAVVEANDGTLRGSATSADGRQLAFGGVVALDGSFSSGSAASGARFAGSFMQAGDSRTYGRGEWILGGSQGGHWQIVRETIPASCK